MHVLFEITLHILKHALRDVQALHVDHDLPNSLVFQFGLFSSMPLLIWTSGAGRLLVSSRRR